MQEKAIHQGGAETTRQKSPPPRSRSRVQAGLPPVAVSCAPWPSPWSTPEDYRPKRVATRGARRRRSTATKRREPQPLQPEDLQPELLVFRRHLVHVDVLRLLILA